MSIDKKHKVPALRFPGFRDEWEEEKLGSMGTFIGGGTPDTSMPEYWNGDIQWFTPTEIKKKYVSKSNRTITEKGLKDSSAKLLSEGTVLISTRATVGDVGIAETRCATNQGFQSLLVNGSEINTFWYYWIIQHKNELVRRSSGSTFLEIGKSEISKIIALRPDKEEQQKIADFLTSVDTKIEQLAEKKALLEQYKKGMMQALFSQARRFKDEDGNDFPDWEERKLGELATKQKKKNINLMHTRVLSNSAVQGVIDQKDCFDHAIAKAENLDAYYIIEKGDYVYNPRISASAPAGPIKRNDLGVGVVSPLYTVFRFKFNNTVFFEKYFSSCFWHSYMKSVANYGARFDRMAISMKDFMNMPLPYPDLKEQQKIADFLSAIDRKITLTDTQLTKAKAFKKGLLQRMFA